MRKPEDIPQDVWVHCGKHERVYMQNETTTDASRPQP
jgi:hypothetical protein